MPWAQVFAADLMESRSGRVLHQRHSPPGGGPGRVCSDMRRTRVIEIQIDGRRQLAAEQQSSGNAGAHARP